MITSQIEALRLFNEKATRLHKSRFAKYVFEQKRFSIHVDAEKGKEVSVITIGPDSHAIDEFILTFRYFIQNNERCSFGNLAEIYPNLSISEELKKRFKRARKGLNDYLNSNTIINIEKNLLTRRRLLDVFIYGGLAHANPGKKKQFDEWMKKHIIRDFINCEFVSILAGLLGIIQHVARLNTEVIRVLTEN